MNAHTQPALRKSLAEIVAEYEEKAQAIVGELSAFKAAGVAMEAACNIGGAYGGSLLSSGWAPYERTCHDVLKVSAWRHVYQGLNIHLLATADERKKFERFFEDPDDFTLENIRERFGDYILDPRYSILKGLAECFGKLDPQYKSHDRVKIGVKGLPKRIILTGVRYWGDLGNERIRDTLYAVRTYQGLPLYDNGQITDFIEEAGKGDDSTLDGFRLRRFNNGNGHLFFDADTLKDINRALAEFYGEVLADTEQAREKAPGTAVAKDLQFYRTPNEVADRLIEGASYRIKPGARILEPSCGDGSLIEAVERYCRANNIDGVRVFGIEQNLPRVNTCRAKGFRVKRGNFLEEPPEAEFDLVLMNPPFYARHYQKHVNHAREFLKEDGHLFAILPITAATDHGFVEERSTLWRELPVGSFRESGTNINTGIAHFFARSK